MLQLNRRPGMLSHKYQTWRRLHALLTSPAGSRRGSTKVTKRNLHLTADISEGFLTFLARCVPCVEFPRCYLNTAALTLWNSWPLGALTFCLIEAIFASLEGTLRATAQILSTSASIAFANRYNCYHERGLKRIRTVVNSVLLSNRLLNNLLLLLHYYLSNREMWWDYCGNTGT